jgi:hypothetical protein
MKLTKEEEKKWLLAVATPEEWDKWLNKMADMYSPRLYDINMNNIDVCLFCATFDRDCDLHQDAAELVDVFFFRRYWSIPREDKIDEVIAKLNELGLWD